MIAINLDIYKWQWQYQISTTFFIFFILPLSYYVYAKYVSKRPNRYNKLEEPLKLTIPIPSEAKPHWKGKRLYPPNHTVRNVNEPNKIQSYCPATGQYLGSFSTTSRKEMDEQIEKAKQAQYKWKRSSFTLRRKVLRTISKFIIDNQDMIARIACRDSGKTKLDALLGEIMVTLEKLNWIIVHGELSLKTSQRPGPSNFLIRMLKCAEVRYEPLGVVAALISWNYPFHNLLGPVVSALFTGNAVVVKCSEQVVWSSMWFVDFLKQVLKTFDISTNLVQLSCCFPEDADYFTSHPGLSHITFIGSKEVATKVIASTAKQLTPSVIELGGKDPLIVLDSTSNPEALSSTIMRGTFQSAGQNCIGIERVICLPKHYETLIEILSSRVEKLRVGSDIDQLDDIDMGAMISDNRFTQLENLVEDAVQKGARLIRGGKSYQHPNYPQGHFFEPTLLVDVNIDMKIFHEEVFGPILTMTKAKDVDDAIYLANATDYGLGGSVFGSDYPQCDYVANNLKTGNVAINDFATYYVAQLPFGGVKKSGFGKFGGEEGLRGLCAAKSVIVDKPFFRTLGIAASIPPQLDYPIDDKESWSFIKTFNIAGYDYSLWQVATAFRKLARGGS